MSRHPDFVPQGVIPAVLLPFHEDLSIDEASFRAHLRNVAAVQLVGRVSEAYPAILLTMKGSGLRYA